MKKLGIYLAALVLIISFISLWQKGYFSGSNKLDHAEEPLLKRYEGKSLSFNHPATWNPSPKNTQAELEIIDLGIPGVSVDQTLEFLDLSLAEQNFTDLSAQEYKTFNNKDWMIGERTVDGEVTYLYYTDFTHDPQINDPRQSLGIHVTLEKDNPELKKQLEELIKSLQYK